MNVNSRKNLAGDRPDIEQISKKDIALEFFQRNVKTRTLKDNVWPKRVQFIVVNGLPVTVTRIRKMTEISTLCTL